LPRYLKFKHFFVAGLRQVVVTHILVAAAKGMALAIRKYLINTRSCSDLCGNHFAGSLTDLFLVGGVLQLAIPSVTGTSFCA